MKAAQDQQGSLWKPAKSNHETLNVWDVPISAGTPN